MVGLNRASYRRKEDGALVEAAQAIGWANWMKVWPESGMTYRVSMERFEQDYEPLELRPNDQVLHSPRDSSTL